MIEHEILERLEELKIRCIIVMGKGQKEITLRQKLGTITPKGFPKCFNANIINGWIDKCFDVRLVFRYCEKTIESIKKENGGGHRGKDN